MSWNPLTAAQEQALRTALSDKGLEAFAEPLLQVGQHCILIQRHEVNGNSLLANTYQKVGSSYFGGVPQVPPGFVWPHYIRNGEKSPHEFVAQINLAEVATYDAHHRLPPSGMLYFFGGYFSSLECEVIYVPESEMHELHLFDMMPILLEKGYEEHESLASESARNFFEREGFERTPSLEYMTFSEGMCFPMRDIDDSFYAMGVLQEGEELHYTVDEALHDIIYHETEDWLLGRDQEVQNEVAVDITDNETARHCLLRMLNACGSCYYSIQQGTLTRQDFSHVFLVDIQW